MVPSTATAESRLRSCARRAHVATVRIRRIPEHVTAARTTVHACMVATTATITVHGTFLRCRPVTVSVTTSIYRGKQITEKIAKAVRGTPVIIPITHKFLFLSCVFRAVAPYCIICAHEHFATIKNGCSAFSCCNRFSIKLIVYFLFSNQWLT